MNSWFVLMGHYGHEERIRVAMVEAGCDAWYPKEQVRVRAKLVEMPLDRYVFIQAPAPLSAELWHVAGECEGFRGWLGGEEPMALRPGELEVWREGFDGAGVLDEAAAERLRRGWDVGDQVMVVDHPLYAGMVGLATGFRRGQVNLIFFSLHGKKASLSLSPKACVRVLIQEVGADAVGRGRGLTDSDGESLNNMGRRRGQGRRKFKRKRKH